MRYNGSHSHRRHLVLVLIGEVYIHQRVVLMRARVEDESRNLSSIGNIENCSTTQLCGKELWKIIFLT